MIGILRIILRGELLKIFERVAGVLDALEQTRFGQEDGGPADRGDWHVLLLQLDDYPRQVLRERIVPHPPTRQDQQTAQAR